jgi:flagellar biosynthesis protein FlhB
MSGELPPSEKRRREARARGQVAVSPLLTAAGATIGGVVAIGFTGRDAAERLLQLARRAFGGELANGQGLGNLLLGEVAATVARVALPVALAAWLGAVAVGLLQSGGLFTLGVFGRAGGAERAGERASRAIPWGLAAALVLLGARVARTIGAALARTDDLPAATAVVADALFSLVPRAVLLLLAAGLGDWAWRRLRLERALRMTRTERERERREEEGDPRLRAESRRRQRALND